MLDGIEALISDARTYVDAELSYQKSRAAFVGDKVKRTLGYGIAAVLIAFIGILALAIGLIIALAPLVTAWGATAIVAGVILIIAIWLALTAARNWSSMIDALGSKEDEE